MNIADSLRAITLYPINPLTTENIAEECGLAASDAVTAAVRSSKPYKRAKAKVYMYLAEAPNVSEAGASYSFTDAERDLFRKMAQALLDEVGEEDESTVDSVGWIGEDF